MGPLQHSTSLKIAAVIRHSAPFVDSAVTREQRQLRPQPLDLPSRLSQPNRQVLRRVLVLELLGLPDQPSGNPARFIS
jgi:hypothetical protein